MAPYIIVALQNVQKGRHPIRGCLPAAHVAQKRGVPSMGGIIILLPCVLSTAVFGDLHSQDIWVILATLAPFAILGGVDDYLKFTKQDTKGVGLGVKLFAQLFMTSAALIFLSHNSSDFTSTHIFSKDLIDLGWVYVPFAYIVVVGSSNSVNLTDGLDGLAIVPVMTSATALGITGHLSLQLGTEAIGATNANIPIFCAALVGSALSFLWFNAHPAKVFMGDLGSLSIGASLGLMSVMLKCELIYAIAGSVFVAEALSTMAQVAYCRLTKGRKIFLVAPVHHHFEKAGLKEATIVTRAWVIAVVSFVISLAVIIYVHR
ncbi:phospho-N-acetylmuramoyl-pentapeptide-transferase [Anaplasma centrale]|nr:phospho-N-acetylmuramoyl-pentapeptide-transferase [Anaplasma centrale]